MPFQVFRRHQRKLLAMLAIMAMFAFVVADSLPRLFNNYARPAGQDEKVVDLGGEAVYRSDLELLRLQRIRANAVLGMLTPYFGPQTFGPTDDASLVDALLLKRKADELQLPDSPELAKNWIFEQARLQHERFRAFSATLPPFDPVGLAAQLQAAFNQAFGREMTEAAFLAEVAGQVRILQALDLLSQTMVTPLDAFDAYSDRQIEVDARYVTFPVEQFLDDVPEPDEATLRSFFDEHADTVPDPSTGTIGFRVPRRAKVEYLALGINAIDVIREQVRGEDLASEIREAEGFAEDVLDAYQAELQRREEATLSQPLPVNPFAEPADDQGEGEALALSYPAEFERQYVAQQVERLVDERTQQRIEDIFDPVKQAMNDFSYEIQVEDLEAIQTGLEPEVDRDALPELDEAMQSGEAGRRLFEALGTVARRDEGITFVRIGLTPTLAEPDTLQELLDPEGIPPAWSDYLALARLDWPDPKERHGYALLRCVHRLTQAAEGVERPDILDPAASESFAEVLFDDNAPLFDPREFTDPDGRRYLAWKTLDLPQSPRSFEQTPEELIVSAYRREKARTLAREAAETLAERVRKAAGEETSPAVALDEIAFDEGLTVRSTGPRRRVESLTSDDPLLAGEELRDALFTLAESGPDAAAVAPDRSQDTYYVLAFSRRGDTSPGSVASSGRIDYTNALTSLQIFRRDADLEAEQRRVENVLEYLRREAGLDPDWTPPEPGRG